MYVMYGSTKRKVGTMKRKLLLVLAIVVVVAACFALVACKKGDGGGDAASKTFVIGIGGPITQGSVDFGIGASRAVQLAVADANESQEAKDLGIQFKHMEGDDQSNPEKASVVANSFVGTADLVGVVGHFNTGVSEPASFIYNEARIVQISYGSTGVSLTANGLDTVFRTCATDDLQGPAAAESAFALGLKTVAVVDDSTPYGQGLVAEFIKKFEELGGKVVYKESYTVGTTDFSSIATAIKAKSPDLVFYGGTYEADGSAGSLLSKQLKDGGVTVPMMGGDGIKADAFIEQAGGAEGDMATLPGMPNDQLPNGQAFVDAFTAKFGVAPGGFDAFAYDAAQAIIKAVFAVAKEKGVDQVTSPDGREAIISTVAASNFEGVTGPVSFDAKGDNQNPVITTYVVKDGAWVPLVVE